MKTLSTVKRSECTAFSFLLLFLLLFSPKISLSQQRLDVPAADGAENPVPFYLIKKIALAKTLAKWGPGVLGDPIPLCNVEGRLTAFMFPYHIGGDRFPSRNEIATRVREAKELREDIRENRIDKARENYKMLRESPTDDTKALSDQASKITSDSMNSYVPAARPDGSPSRRHEVAKIMEIEKFAMKRATGGDTFGTIVVSATYDRIPVLVYYHFLSPYFTDFDMALQEAQKNLGQDALLDKIYFMAVKGLYYEFSGGGRKVLLHGSTFGIKDINQLRAGQIPSQQSSQLTRATIEEGLARGRAKIAEEWQRIKFEVGEK